MENIWHFLTDITIIKSTKNYIVGNFLTISFRFYPDGYPSDRNPAPTGGTGSIQLELDFHPRFFLECIGKGGLLLILKYHGNSVCCVGTCKLCRPRAGVRQKFSCLRHFPSFKIQMGFYSMNIMHSMYSACGRWQQLI